ncbi:hypothetical protein C0J52_23310 [Blattella germanica]|nr:hypothetical protein C0J52_23310 [Blattella germanica]
MTEIKKEQTLVDTKLHVLENMCIKEEPVEFDEEQKLQDLFIMKDELHQCIEMKLECPAEVDVEENDSDLDPLEKNCKRKRNLLAIVKHLPEPKSEVQQTKESDDEGDEIYIEQEVDPITVISIVKTEEYDGSNGNLKLRDDSLFQCDICCKSFAHEVWLLTHVHLHKDQGPYPCFVCNKTYLKKSFFEKHFLVHTTERPYICTVCNKTFLEKTNLKIHERSHTGERPFSCVICNKTFTQRTNLKNHLRVHTGERPYPCSLCDKSFTEKSNLNAHIRIHTGDRPFSCSVCNKSFTQKHSLDTHIRSHTGEKPFHCSTCPRTFVEKFNCDRHIRKHAEGKGKKLVSTPDLE